MEELLEGLLSASLTGVALCTPLRSAAGSLIDFTIDLLNPAAQRMLGKPARPSGTYLQCYPHALSTGVFAFQCTAFESGEPAQLEVNYQGDGLNSHFHLSAQRVGQGLLVSFFDTAQEPRPAAEVALREGQAQEQAARAAAEHEWDQVQALLQQAPVAIGLLEGPEFRVTAVNPLLSGMWGRTPAEVLHLPILEAVPELQGQGFEKLLQQVLETQVPYVGTEVPAYMLRDGHLRKTYYNFVYQPFYDALGAVQGVLNVALEVTEQVEARERVQAQEQQTSQLNEELTVINEELQNANREIQLNVAALELAQLDLHQLNQTLETRVARRTQEVQHARAAAEGQRLRLERLLMQAPVAICMLDGPALVYELVNPSYQQLFAGRALLGRPMLEALPELADQPVWHALRRVYETGETHQEIDQHISLARHAGGPLRDFYFNYTHQARYDEQGRIDGVLVFTFDVTEQVRVRQRVQELNEQLAAINAELQASNRELSDTNQELTRTNVDLDNFIYTASHDLRAPITNIEGLLHVLDIELPATRRAGEVTHILSLMLESVDRFKRTIGHLTDISKLQQEYARPTSQVNLQDIIAEVRLDLAPLLHATQAQLLVEVHNCAPLAFSEKNLRSVVYNLLSNALKYHHPDRAPVVGIRCHKAAGYQVLTVQDNGLGLAATSQARLFQMFQRLHTHVEGSGIGLYMVKRIMENAGGRIEVQSQLEVGTTFSVYFPVAAT